MIKLELRQLTLIARQLRFTRWFRRPSRWGHQRIMGGYSVRVVGHRVCSLIIKRLRLFSGPKLISDHFCFNGGHRLTWLRSGFSSLKIRSVVAFSSGSLRLNSFIGSIIIGPLAVINTGCKSVGAIQRLIFSYRFKYIFIVSQIAV